MSVHKHMLSWKGLAFIIGIPWLIAIWPLFGQIEGKLLPVVSKLQISETTRDGSDLIIYGEFTKNRPCSFVGLNWYEGSRRLNVEFLDRNENSPSSRSLGLQTIGPWVLKNVGNVEDTKVETIHQCHPFWQTYTAMYP